MSAAAEKQAVVVSSPSASRGNGRNAAGDINPPACAAVGGGWPASRRPAFVVLSGGPAHGGLHPAPDDRWSSLYLTDDHDTATTHCYRPHPFDPATWTYSGPARVIEQPTITDPKGAPPCQQ